MALRACAQCMVFNNQWPILILETSMSMPETEPISAVLIQGSSVESFYWCIFSEFSDLIFSQPYVATESLDAHSCSYPFLRHYSSRKLPRPALLDE